MLLLKGIPNSIDFYKGVFVHVTSVRIKASWPFRFYELIFTPNKSFTDFFSVDGDEKVVALRNQDNLITFSTVGKFSKKKTSESLWY